jgi:NADP-dependent 3-hydroxy acid dehydrogenase YdfG
MEARQSHQEDNEEMIKMNIKQFIEATRQYLFEMASTQQPVLATIPVCGKR